MGPGDEPPDASKCSALGEGLNNAKSGEIATFEVDANSGGRGSLTVGVEGPSIPADEVTIKRVKDKTYKVAYVAEAPGQYTIRVKWGDEHIPGSPFTLNVV